MIISIISVLFYQVNQVDQVIRVLFYPADPIDPVICVLSAATPQATAAKLSLLTSNFLTLSLLAPTVFQGHYTVKDRLLRLGVGIAGKISQSEELVALSGLGFQEGGLAPSLFH